jgi:alpha/beta superfamily hydrolase
MASLRFDFRGVGRSEGDFSNGEEEWNDVKHALNFLRSFPGVDGSKIGIVGYSFGASVVLRALSKLKQAKTFALIAPPLGSVEDRGVKKDKRAKLFVVGRDDAVVPSPRLQRQLDDLRGPVQFTEVPDADHRLNGHEREVAERVVDYMLQTLLP